MPDTHDDPRTLRDLADERDRLAALLREAQPLLACVVGVSTSADRAAAALYHRIDGALRNS